MSNRPEPKALRRARAARARRNRPWKRRGGGHTIVGASRDRMLAGKARIRARKAEQREQVPA